MERKKMALLARPLKGAEDPLAAVLVGKPVEEVTVGAEMEVIKMQPSEFRMEEERSRYT